MSTDLLFRLIRQSPSERSKSHEELIAQKLTNARSSTIIARLAKVYIGVIRSCSRDCSVAHADANRPAPDWKSRSSQSYSRRGVNYVQVRALSTVPTFIGLDTRNYSLQKGDVLFIPYENAQVLYARELAAPAERVVANTISDKAPQLDQEERASVSSDNP